MASTKKLTQEQVIARFKLKHGDKYDYSLVKYVNSTTLVDIICPTHGVFPQIPKSHMVGKGCKFCKTDKMVKERTLTKEEFIERAKQFHGDKYDYSLSEYVNSKIEVDIICPIHGKFGQMPSVHYRSGCPDCGIDNNADSKRLSFDEFINRSNLHHKDKNYDYSLVRYKNGNSHVEIICPIHGVFKQIAMSHMLGCGCTYCNVTAKSNSEEFIIKAISIHSDTYDYSLVDYIDAKEYVQIICKKHGVFPQTPNNHLNGQGCPYCCKFGFDKTKESTFYIYKADNFIGFGITNNIKQRDAQHKAVARRANVTLTLHKQYILCGEAALKLENEVKIHFKSHSLNTGITGFRREAITPDQLENLSAFIDTYIKENPQTV